MIQSNKDKVEIIFFCAKPNWNYNDASRWLNDSLADRPVLPSYVRNVVIKFSTTISIKNTL